MEGGAGELRIRVGAYHAIYERADDVLLVLVLAVGPRKDGYRGHDRERAAPRFDALGRIRTASRLGARNGRDTSV
jgi:putative component of toxin-antitoxin plasmid stabilization module